MSDDIINNILFDVEREGLYKMIQEEEYELKEDYSFYGNAFHKMEYQYGLIEIKQYDYNYSLTDFGQKVIFLGGWLEHLKIEEKKLKKIAKKEKLDYLISDWQVRTKWLPLILSIAALIASIVAICID